MATAEGTESGGRPWSGAAIGARIDALESALNAFETRTVDSLIPLRRRIGRIEAAAGKAGLAAIAATAESARLAGASEVKERTQTLLALLRQAAHEAKRPRVEEQVLDAATGLMTCGCLSRRVGQAIESGLVPAGMVALEIEQLAAIRSARGESAALRAIAHVGSILRKTLREHDCIARVGDDRLVMFLRGEEEDGVRVAIQRVRDAVGRRPLRWDDGSETSLTLTPVALGPGSAPGRAAAAADAAIQPKVCILTDSPSTGKTFRLLFERAGYDVAISGRPDAEAWVLLMQIRVRLVVVDTAPERLEAVLDEVRASCARHRLPAVLVTGPESGREAALDHGALDYLTKPVHPEALLRSAERLLSRGRRGKSCRSAAKPCVLVASDDLVQLIAMGSSLQKQAGLNIRLSRGAADTIEQARQHRPAAAVIDLRLDQEKTPEVLAVLAELDPAADVILVAEDREKRRAETVTRPAIVRVIGKPVPLLNLAASVTSATGLEASPAGAESAEVLRQEILRVMELNRAAAGA